MSELLLNDHDETPSAPAAGKKRIYAKADGIYSLNSEGEEVMLSNEEGEGDEILLDEVEETPANPVAGKAKVYAKEDGVYSLNSSGDEVLLSNPDNVDNVLLNELVGTPANPASGKQKVYAKSDGVYALNSVGTEVLLSPAAADLYKSIWVDAGAMVSRTTNGAASATEEYATNDIMSDHFLFDKDTSESVQFRMSLPTKWNLGTIKAKFYWDAAAGSGGVVWGIKAGAYSDLEAIDSAVFGTEIETADTLDTIGDCHIATSAAITVGSSPAADDMIVFNIARKVSHGSDTLTGDAKLLGVKIQYQESTTPSVSW
jgi:hypothetical protein